jgi:hypothetical protein
MTESGLHDHSDSSSSSSEASANHFTNGSAAFLTFFETSLGTYCDGCYTERQ